jgi:hypothetical protein
MIKEHPIKKAVEKEGYELIFLAPETKQQVQS